MDMSQLDLSNLIVHFAQSNKVEGKSPKTVSWYSEMLTSFAKHLEAIEIQPTLAELDITNVREFIIYEQGRQVSPYLIAVPVLLFHPPSSSLTQFLLLGCFTCRD